MRTRNFPKRFLPRFAAAAAILSTVGCATTDLMPRSFLYHPQPFTTPPDTQEVAIAGDRGILHGWVVNPGQPSALIYFGGNGEAVERNVDFFRAALRDCSVYLIPYRGYGPNPGRSSEAVIYADALAEYAFVHDRHAHVAAMGRSLGTGVATWLASNANVEKVVLVTPYDSVLNVAQGRFPILPVSLLLKDRYESWRRAGSIAVPILILLAENDQVVPRSNSDALIARFPTRPTVVVIPDADHNTLSGNPAYAQAIADFMRAPVALPPSPPAPSR
jgi:pimeloyl-ACP methyl ester carboxylesterase